MDESDQESGEGTALPFIAPCRDLQPFAPLRWVRLGWRDMWSAPRQSLTYGLVIVVLSLALARIAIEFGG
jgi:hypothetical protein